MAERTPTLRPMIVGGTSVESGTPNTGQIQTTLGGSRTFTKLSGTAGGDANIVQGGGRLDAIYIIPSADAGLSGLPLLFYDSAVAVSGGPLATSGHKVIAGFQIPPGVAPVLSGTLNVGGMMPVGMVFTSGLCHQSASGQRGFTVSYTPSNV